MPSDPEQQQVRRQIGDERAELAVAVEALRTELHDATNVAGRLRTGLPLLAFGALTGGFVLAGGVGATARLLFRRGRERRGRTRARVGRYRVVERS